MVSIRLKKKKQFLNILKIIIIILPTPNFGTLLKVLNLFFIEYMFNLNNNNYNNIPIVYFWHDHILMFYLCGRLENLSLPLRVLESWLQFS